MNTVDILRGLLRRWYIVVPGILLSAALALGAWMNIGPTYERSARQLLLPGLTSIPDGGNPYLFIGGLAQTADVVVLAMSSNNVLDEVAKEHPDVAVEVTRDTSTSSPVIVIEVSAPSDAEAAKVLEMLVAKTSTVVTELQDQEDIAAKNRISVNTVTVDGQSVLQQRDRMVAAAGVGAAGIVLTILIAALVDGIVISRRRRSAAFAEKQSRSDQAGGEPEEPVSGWLDSDDPEAALAGDLPADELGSVVGADDHVTWPDAARPESDGAAEKKPTARRKKAPAKKNPGLDA